MHAMFEAFGISVYVYVIVVCAERREERGEARTHASRMHVACVK
jgi:hypothetical protein